MSENYPINAQPMFPYGDCWFIGDKDSLGRPHGRCIQYYEENGEFSPMLEGRFEHGECVEELPNNIEDVHNNNNRDNSEEYLDPEHPHEEHIVLYNHNNEIEDIQCGQLKLIYRYDINIDTIIKDKDSEQKAKDFYSAYNVFCTKNQTGVTERLRKKFFYIAESLNSSEPSEYQKDYTTFILALQMFLYNNKNIQYQNIEKVLQRCVKGCNSGTQEMNAFIRCINKYYFLATTAKDKLKQDLSDAFQNQLVTGIFNAYKETGSGKSYGSDQYMNIIEAITNFVAYLNQESGLQEVVQTLNRNSKNDSFLKQFVKKIAEDVIVFIPPLNQGQALTTADWRKYCQDLKSKIIDCLPKSVNNANNNINNNINNQMNNNNMMNIQMNNQMNNKMNNKMNNNNILSLNNNNNMMNNQINNQMNNRINNNINNQMNNNNILSLNNNNNMMNIQMNNNNMNNVVNQINNNMNSANNIAINNMMNEARQLNNQFEQLRQKAETIIQNTVDKNQALQLDELQFLRDMYRQYDRDILQHKSAFFWLNEQERRNNALLDFLNNNANDNLDTLNRRLQDIRGGKCSWCCGDW